MKQDIRHAFRVLRQQPAFSAVAILTLALGIGANTAIFSVVNSVLLRPLPYPDSDRIMVLNESSGPGQDYSVALPDYFDWRNENTVFEHLAATHKESRNLSGIRDRDPERISCASVTRNFFSVIGVSPEIGRIFSEDEDKIGASPVVVISDRLWQRVFNRNPDVLGRSITLHDQNFIVIGVMPPQMTSPQDTDAWFSIMRRSNNPARMDRSRHPMIFVWDDHDIADNAWRDGAKHHDPNEHGPWPERLRAAATARQEWLPARLADPADPLTLYRSLTLGDLAEVVLLDTRIIGRDVQPDDDATLPYDDRRRSMLGDAQRTWAHDRVRDTTRPWCLLVTAVVLNHPAAL